MLGIWCVVWGWFFVFGDAHVLRSCASFLCHDGTRTVQDNPAPAGASRYTALMVSSTEAALRSRRLHTVKNVDKNIREARQRALEQQQRIEALAKPLHAVSAKLTQLDRESGAAETAGQRKIESLQSGLEKKIEKLKADTAAKIEQAKKDTAARLEQVHTSQQESEDALLLEYASAIVQFSNGGSAGDLATVLGISRKAAKELIDTAHADVKGAGIDTAEAANDPAPEAAHDSPPPTADDDVSERAQIAG